MMMSSDDVGHYNIIKAHIIIPEAKGKKEKVLGNPIHQMDMGVQTGTDGSFFIIFIIYFLIQYFLVTMLKYYY